MLRRVNNAGALADLDGLWQIPVAGFSTFGELLGINVNQTLTAVVFFDAEDGDFRDDFLDAFPVHYASFCSYFTRRHLNRIEIRNRLRSEITHRLILNSGLSAGLADKIEMMLDPTSDVRATMENVRATIASELAREERARQAERRLANAIEAIGERFALYDENDRLVVCNSHYRDIFDGSGAIIRPGQTFSEITRIAAERGIYGYGGEDLDRFLADRMARHR
jgi:PAS domain-containing protein